MNSEERLFDAYLDRDPQDDNLYPSSSDYHVTGAPNPGPAVLRAIQTVTLLRRITAPEGELAPELADARSRVSARVFDVLAQEDDVSPFSGPVRSISVSITSRQRHRLAYTCVAAFAIVLLGMAIGWQVSFAAASALPGSPLYTLKRGEEWAALHMSWSDQRRGEALATIGRHRLTEACAEASSGDASLVYSLTAEFDGDMRQLIALTAHMADNHEDTTVVATALTLNLRAEYRALAGAKQSGETPLAQALTASVQTEQADITTQHVVLPNIPTLQPPVSGSTPAATAPAATPSPSASPTPHPTETPPGKGNGGGGNGGGGGGGNGNGPPGVTSTGHAHNANAASSARRHRSPTPSSGKPTPTPTPTPAPTPTHGSGNAAHKRHTNTASRGRKK